MEMAEKNRREVNGNLLASSLGRQGGNVKQGRQVSGIAAELMQFWQGRRAVTSDSWDFQPAGSLMASAGKAASGNVSKLLRPFVLISSAAGIQ